MPNGKAEDTVIVTSPEDVNVFIWGRDSGVTEGLHCEVSAWPVDENGTQIAEEDMTDAQKKYAAHSHCPDPCAEGYGGPACIFNVWKNKIEAGERISPEPVSEE